MLLEMSVKLRRGHLDLTTQLTMSDASVGLFGKSGAGNHVNVSSNSHHR